MLKPEEGEFSTGSRLPQAFCLANMEAEMRLSGWGGGGGCLPAFSLPPSSSDIVFHCWVLLKENSSCMWMNNPEIHYDIWEKEGKE